MSSWVKPPLGSQLFTGHPLSLGLVGLWLMNEGVGTIIQDLSGNRYNGIATGATNEISWVGGPEGPAIDFVGNTQAGFVFSQINFVNTIPWTLVIKIRVDDNFEAIPLGVYGGANDYIWFYGGNFIRFRANGSNDDFSSVSSFTSWATYAFVCTGDSNLSLYVDGIFKETIGPISDFDITCIGNGYNNDGYTLDGQISYVYAWNGRALSGSEIAQLYAEPFCMFGRDTIELWSAATQGGEAPSGIPILRRRRECA